ncbi:MAG: pyridine nucleotide-disulfide oxidoreductase [Chloroflexi bacterium RBG_19FT_COMBO_49_13]|nr:MAG: pyridine nucleotide-disulfide oxidoreductase [Chloroflexi bacterium RBG_19FT_COMBO_49_13]
MASYKYLIIGAGMTADAAVRGIRELDPEGGIGMIGNDPHPPYNRPPLTKALWKGKPLESIWRRTEGFSVDLLLGRTVRSIEPGKKMAWDDQGADYKYDKLLLATGGTPRRLPFGPPDMIYYRTLDDYQHLREMSGHVEHFAVIGGGFIGSEITAALTMNGVKVTLLFPQAGIGARIYPAEISNYLNTYFQGKGVEVISGVSVTDIHKHAATYHLVTDKGGDIRVDGVIAGIGIQPNVELAQSAGLTVGNGILVDEILRSSAPDIFAAGDVAEFSNPTLGKRLRLEHEDNANNMGKQVGRNMAGANEPYHYLPYFYSDLFELGYEAVGELDSRRQTFVDWKDPMKKGVVYYLADGRVRGVLLWNVWDTIPKARLLIAEPGPFTPDDLKDRL